MIQSFQDRVLNKIDNFLKSAGLETSIAYDWSNTGNVYGHRAGWVRPKVTIGFNFQPETYTLTLTVRERRIPSQVGRAEYFDFYHQKATDKSRFWVCLDEELKKLEEVKA